MGCIFTNQLKVQLYTAIYFVCIDAVLCSQYIYYQIWKKRKERKQDDETQNLLAPEVIEQGNGVNLSASINVTTIIGLVAFFGLFSIAFAQEKDGGQDVCNEPFDPDLGVRIFGDICAWTSGSLYFFSRIPQVILNYRRKSTEGLNGFMFLASVFANVFYGASIVLSEVDWTSGAFWESTFPYIFGSWGTVIWSAAVLIQVCIYKNSISEEYREI